MEKTPNRITAAILYATQQHGEQLRKGTKLPYIIHPLEVMQILIRMNAHEELVLAGILHDTVEDTDATGEDIDFLFGGTVAKLVAAHTHPKGGDWWETRQKALSELAEAPYEVKLLVLADKLSNLRSMAADYRLIGEKLWERFNASKEMQSRYYSASIDALDGLQQDPNTAWAYWELNALYKDLFVTFSIDDDHTLLMQETVHGESSYLMKNGLQWRKLPDNRHMNPIPRWQAELIEDTWRYPG